MCKIFKKFLQQIQSYEDASFLGPKWFICTQQKMFFLKKMFNIILINLLAPFIWQNLKKFFRSNPELLGCAIFRPTITQFVLNKMFWYKPLLLLSSTYWPLSLGKIKKKKNSAADPELWGCAIFETKMIYLPQTKNFLENY